MTVLTFFVIISMSLSGIQIFGVDLPSEVSGTDDELVDKADPLVLGLTSEGQMLLENEPTDLQALAEVIRTYFSENPDGTLMLKADRSLPYSDVSKMLADLRSIGGKRVSLAVE